MQTFSEFKYILETQEIHVLLELNAVQNWLSDEDGSICFKHKT